MLDFGRPTHHEKHVFIGGMCTVCNSDPFYEFVGKRNQIEEEVMANPVEIPVTSTLEETIAALNNLIDEYNRFSERVFAMLYEAEGRLNTIESRLQAAGIP